MQDTPKLIPSKKRPRAFSYHPLTRTHAGGRRNSLLSDSADLGLGYLHLKAARGPDWVALTGVAVGLRKGPRFDFFFCYTDRVPL